MGNLGENIIHKRIVVSGNQEAIRVDKYLRGRLSEISRTKIQKALENGNILVNGKVVEPSYKIKPKDVLEIILPKEEPEFIELLPEPIPLDIIYEDEYIAVINKPAGMVVHPGAGHKSGTIVNALLYHFKNVSRGGSIRPGLIHRLDVGTSGVLLVAKDEDIHYKIAMQFFLREVKKKYLALVWAQPSKNADVIETYIKRDPKNRKIMRAYSLAMPSTGKLAITEYKVVESYYFVSLVECYPITGRTHQIRAHMKYLGTPIFGDSDYGGNKILKGVQRGAYLEFVKGILGSLNRGLLHAYSIKVFHPVFGKYMEFTAPIPTDMENVINLWKENYKKFLNQSALDVDSR